MNVRGGYVTPQQVTDGALWCMDKIEQLTGRTPILYTGDWFMRMIPDDERFFRFPLWFASYDYPKETLNIPGRIEKDNIIMPSKWYENDIDWYIWQFASKYGTAEISQAGYEWPKNSMEWHRSVNWLGKPVVSHCDINFTTREKFAELLGESVETDPPTTPPVVISPVIDRYEEGRGEVLDAMQSLIDSERS